MTADANPAAYDAIAEWYDRSIREAKLLPGNEVVGAALFDAIGHVEGQAVCDLACGQGEMARQLAQRGVNVVGVDISGRLLEIARREEESHPFGITYVQDDARYLDRIAEPAFDGVLCSMALMDIPDLNGVFRTVRRLLVPGGWFVFSITHPCFQIPPSRSYYDEGFWRSDNPHGVRGQVGARHRTLGTYMNALGEAGLVLERLSEPRLPGRDAPVVLVARCRKVAANPAE